MVGQRPLTPEQEDLYWLLTSPVLISALKNAPSTRIIDGKYSAAFSNRTEFSSMLGSIKLPLRPSFKRLGLYAEALYHIFCSHHEKIDVVGHNIQIQHAINNITKGEFDFLIAHDKELIHLEMAVKFYLYDHQLQLFIGPNANDQLDKKLRKMATQQLQLSKTDEGHAVVQELGYSNAHSQLLIKGVLFHHWQQQLPNVLDQKEFIINPRTEWGLWLKVSEWGIFNNRLIVNRSLRAIPKIAWMGLNASKDGNDAKLSITPTRKNPLGMWVIEDTLKGRLTAPIYETRRIMVVPDDWPRLATGQKPD